VHLGKIKRECGLIEVASTCKDPLHVKKEEYAKDFQRKAVIVKHNSQGILVSSKGRQATGQFSCKIILYN